MSRSLACDTSAGLVGFPGQRHAWALIGGNRRHSRPSMMIRSSPMASSSFRSCFVRATVQVITRFNLDDCAAMASATSLPLRKLLHIGGRFALAG